MNTPQCKISKGLAANTTSHGPVEQGAPMDRHVSGSGLFLRRLSWTPRKKPGVKKTSGDGIQRNPEKIRVPKTVLV